MEGLKEFLAVSYGDGSGSGSGYGSGSGSGYGYGDGDGSGSGYGYGSGSGYGYGSGYGSGDGIKSLNGSTVYQIDGVATILTKIRGNIAKGGIVGSDLQVKPCYVVKVGDHFAHGDTVNQATEDAERKALEDMDDEDRVELFLSHFNLSDSYQASEFVDWHGRLTGSCRMGRDQFVKDRQIDLEAKYTVAQFVEIVKNAYGSEVIDMLKQRLGEVNE